MRYALTCLLVIGAAYALSALPHAHEIEPACDAHAEALPRQNPSAPRARFTSFVV